LTNENAEWLQKTRQEKQEEAERVRARIDELLAARSTIDEELAALGYEERPPSRDVDLRGVRTCFDLSGGGSHRRIQRPHRPWPRPLAGAEPGHIQANFKGQGDPSDSEPGWSSRKTGIVADRRTSGMPLGFLRRQATAARSRRPLTRPRLAPNSSRIDITRRMDVLGGRTFGTAGPYESLTGTAHFAVDPANPHDLRSGHRRPERRPTNAQGRVEFSADIYIIKPKDQRPRQRRPLFDIRQPRQQGIARRVQPRRTLSDPTTEADFGDASSPEAGYYARRRRWQFDIPMGKALVDLRRRSPPRRHADQRLGPDAVPLGPNRRVDAVSRRLPTR